MKQQKRHRWYGLAAAMMALALVLPGVIPTQQVSAGPLPAGKVCPPPGVWDNVEDRCTADDGAFSQCQEPYELELNILDTKCVAAPVDSADKTDVAQGGTKAENQDGCDANLPGTIFKDGQCVSPGGEKDCPAGYTYEAGENTPGDPTTNNKCNKDDQDACPIPTGSGIGSTPLRWAGCPLIEAANTFLVGCATIPTAQQKQAEAAEGAVVGPGGVTEAGPNAEEAAKAAEAECDGGLNGYIHSYLYTDADAIFNTDTKAGSAYHDSWNIFRTFGVGLVVLAGLIMIVAEAFGVGFVDAYTIRKVLPRLLVAAIGVTLSWSLCAFAITFFNDLGSWMHSLVTFPFEGINDAGGWALEKVLTQWLAVGGALLFLGVSGILLILGMAILALVIGAAILIFRQMLIVLLIIIAPLAIACSVLPNTQKLFSLWLSTFIRTLVMYPVIIAFLAVGIVFSWLASQQTSPGSGIIAVAAYLIPYFALPYAFKLSGGAMATVASLAQDKSKGAFAAGKNKLGEISAERRSAMKAERLLNFKNDKLNRFVGQPMNKALAGVGTGTKGKFGMAGLLTPGGIKQSFRRDGKWQNGFAIRNRANQDAAIAKIKNERKDNAAYERTDEFSAISGSDDHMEARSHTTSEGAARTHLREKALGNKNEKVDAENLARSKRGEAKMGKAEEKSFRQNLKDKAEKKAIEDENTRRMNEDKIGPMDATAQKKFLDSRYQSADRDAARVAAEVAQNGGYGGSRMLSGAIAYAATGTAYPKGELGGMQLSRAMAASARGSLQAADTLAAEMNGAVAKNGRHDVGYGFGQNRALAANAMASGGVVSAEFVQGAEEYHDVGKDGKVTIRSTAGTLHDNGKYDAYTKTDNFRGANMSVTENATLRSRASDRMTDKATSTDAMAEYAAERIKQGVEMVENDIAPRPGQRTAEQHMEIGARILADMHGARSQGNGHAVVALDKQSAAIRQVVEGVIAEEGRSATPGRVSGAFGSARDLAANREATVESSRNNPMNSILGGTGKHAKPDGNTADGYHEGYRDQSDGS